MLCGPQSAFELLLFVLLLHNAFAGDGVAVAFEPGDLAIDDVEILGGLQKFLLRRDQIFVREPDAEQWAARLNRLALHCLDVGHNAGQRRSDMNLRAAGLLDDNRGNRHGPLELAQLDLHALKADVLESLVAELDGIDVRVVGMIVVVIRLLAVTMFGVRVMVCQFGFALRSFWQPVRTRNPSDCTQCGNDRHGNQPITTTGMSTL